MPTLPPDGYHWEYCRTGYTNLSTDFMAVPNARITIETVQDWNEGWVLVKDK